MASGGASFKGSKDRKLWGPDAVKRKGALRRGSKPPHPSVMAKMVAKHAQDGVDTSFAFILRVDPDDNILVGAERICRYIGVTSMSTLMTWIEKYSFPAMRRPIDGRWISSMTAIDQWIFIASEVAADSRVVLRSMQLNAKRMMERLQAQIDDPEELKRSVLWAASRAGRGVGVKQGFDGSDVDGIWEQGAQGLEGREELGEGESE